MRPTAPIDGVLSGYRRPYGRYMTHREVDERLLTLGSTPWSLRVFSRLQSAPSFGSSVHNDNLPAERFHIQRPRGPGKSAPPHNISIKIPDHAIEAIVGGCRWLIELGIHALALLLAFPILQDPSTQIHGMYPDDSTYTYIHISIHIYIYIDCTSYLLYVHIYMCKPLPTYLPTYLSICLHFLYICIHTYRQTYIYIYMYTRIANINTQLTIDTHKQV